MTEEQFDRLLHSIRAIVREELARCAIPPVPSTGDDVLDTPLRSLLHDPRLLVNLQAKGATTLRELQAIGREEACKWMHHRSRRTVKALFDKHLPSAHE